ncbi:MAG: PEP-utilizing enzyme [Planctomycetota bacterium]
MPWKPLARFGDERAGKLHRLKRAARARLDVPPTRWVRSADASRAGAPPIVPPLILRSASPDEDTAERTNAGHYESIVVRCADDLPRALERVAASVGNDGYVFAQQLAEDTLGPDARGGVAFFDGFYYERSEAPGHNRGVTAGETRGETARGELEPGCAFSLWLRRVGRAFRAELRASEGLDLEYATDGERYVLLQARPLTFRVKRNPTLSLANHREILGELPSPWIVDALVAAGRGSIEEFVRIDPEVGRWRGQYAESHHGRAWLSFSFFFRLMDHWGLPRSMVTDGVGGTVEGRAARRPNLLRMARKSPRLVRLQLQNVGAMRRIDDELARIEEATRDARTLADWYDATVVGLDVALRTNFAINGALSGIVRVRGALRVRGRAHVVTDAMREEFEAVRGLEPSLREAALDRWLEAYGHRGPLESDPAQPRFRELREELLEDVRGANDRPEPSAPHDDPPKRTGRSGGLLFRVDALRERFRDELMRRWEPLRAGALRAAETAVAAGHLEAPEDAFLLGDEVHRNPAAWAEVVTRAKERRAREAELRFPTTAPLSELDGIARAGRPPTTATASMRFEGIGLGTRPVTGEVVRADDLAALLGDISSGRRPPIGPETVLVTRALEPAWGILFGRVGAVVAEIGGELSHASILLREAGTTAVVNCAGAYDTLSDGTLVHVDPKEGAVERV